MPVTERQLQANRANAQQSTGPRTAEGKAASSRNALKTGLTGRSILLSADEADAYEHHVARFACDFNPLGDREHELVQSLADTQWRLNRIPSLEAGIYATGRMRYADLFAGEPAELQPMLIETHTYLTHQKELKNLGLQESRLRRQYATDLAELKALQAQRAETAAAEPARANGFEFSPALATAASATATAPTDSPASIMSPHANGRIAVPTDSL